MYVRARASAQNHTRRVMISRSSTAQNVHHSRENNALCRYRTYLHMMHGQATYFSTWQLDLLVLCFLPQKQLGPFRARESSRNELSSVSTSVFFIAIYL